MSQSNYAETIPHNPNASPHIESLFDANEQLKNPGTRRDFFAAVNDDNFIDLLQTIAAHVRGDGSGAMQIFDGDHITVGDESIIDQRDKEKWIRDAWYIAREFLENYSIEDQAALDYAGLTIAGALHIIHPFIDGNGRTSRVVSNMIMRPDVSKVRHLMSDSKTGRDTWAIPDMRLNSGRIYKNPQPSDIVWQALTSPNYPDSNNQYDKISNPPEIDTFGGLVSADRNADTIVREFIELYPDIVQPFIENNPQAIQSLNGFALLEHIAHKTDLGTAMFSVRAIGEIQRKCQFNGIRSFLVGIIQNKQHPLQSSEISELATNAGTRRIPEDVIAILSGSPPAASFIDHLRIAHYTHSAFYNL